MDDSDEFSVIIDEVRPNASDDYESGGEMIEDGEEQVEGVVRDTEEIESGQRDTEEIENGERDTEEIQNGERDTEEEAMEEMVEPNNNALDMPLRKVKEPSAVWKVAERVGGGAKCNFCKKIYKCAQGSTTNIIAHMQSKHQSREEVKILVSEQRKKKQKITVKRCQTEKKRIENNQPLISNFSNRRGLMDVLKRKKLDSALVKMTICMNRPFSDVENFHFRNLLFIAEPNYIMPSRKRHTSNFDAEAVKVVDNLKNEIIKDVTEAGHKTICITSDHGTSSDQFRTKKNALTVARCDKDFVIKKDIIKMIKCDGSQTGKKIREDVKTELESKAGWKEDWSVNWTTDNEAKQVNARLPGKHPEVGLLTNYTGLDIPFHLNAHYNYYPRGLR